MAELENMGTDKAGQSSAPAGVSWPKVSRQYRWDQPVSAFNKSAGASTSSTTETSTGATSTANQSTNKPVTKPASVPVNYTYTEPKRSDSFYAMAAPLSNVSQYSVILDVSDGASKFIPGAVHVDYKDFLTNNTLRSAPELAKILGNAGISRNDSVLIYGECMPCGGGPAVSTYAYWILRYLGHDPSKIRVLDGGITSWAEANHSVVNESQSKLKINYTFEQKPDLLATLEQVKKDGYQMVDARSLQEFGAESIPGSINIPYDSVMTNGRIKDEDRLKVLFSGIRKNKPVVVYTTTGVKASLVWFTLEIMGYDARLSTWQEMTKA